MAIAGVARVSKVQIHVGETLEQVGARVAVAWHRTQRSEDVREAHVTFVGWETMVRTLSPKWLALLRHVHAYPARSVHALAASLGRTYRRVRSDIEALEEAGLLERDGDGVRAACDAFDVQMTVAL